MRRAANSLIHSIKDGIRGVRYSIRVEAEAPGSALPKALREINFGPLAAIGSAVGTPAVRLADELFAQVETVAGGLLVAPDVDAAPFPCAVTDYFAASGRSEAAFLARIYGEIKRTLVRHGVQNMLISEHALDTAWSRFSARHRDMLSPSAGQEVLLQACAGLACVLAEARPVQRVDFGSMDAGKQPFMLSPNLYCALVIGLATALATVRPEVCDDRDAVIESADSAVGARFGRFKRAMSGKAPIPELLAEFQAILPFLP